MVDRSLLQSTLLELLAIPSPSGFTNEVVRYIASQLESMSVDYDITRRGTIRARLPGDGSDDPAQAIVNHVDTIGAMVREIKPDGRLGVAPIGFWSSRFAEGSRVTLFSEQKAYRGTLLPTLQWGVSHDRGVDETPIDWDHVELRLDAIVEDAQGVADLGVEVGDFIALDSSPEVLEDGFIVGRSLDNKAGAAAVLAAIRHITENKVELPRETYFLFTVTETVGSGAGSAILPRVSELVTVDFASVPATEEAAFERVTIASGDVAGPYDYHLTAHLHRLALDNGIPCRRRVLAASHSDAASALAAGHDVRTAVVTYAGDASHSIERTHFKSLENIVRLLLAYLSSEPTFKRDTTTTTVSEFSHQIDTEGLPEQDKDLPDVAEVIRRNQ